MSSRYAWIIDTDHLAEPDADGKLPDPGSLCYNAATVSGPSDAPAALLAELAAGKGIKFRIRDDDKILYYTGRFVPAELSDSEEGFGPLDDFGTPNAGAVTIEYKRGRSWVVL